MGRQHSTSRRIEQLRSSLADERGGRVVFASHCLLNENTRYLGGASRSGAVVEVIDPVLARGVGICQMPCPEQRVWGGVLKRRLLVAYGRPHLLPISRHVLPLFVTTSKVRYRLLARRVARQIVDYQSSGYVVEGIIGVGASPTCGVTTTVDLTASLEAVGGCPLARLDRRFVNDVVAANVRPGRGMFIAALADELRRHHAEVPLFEHDLRSEWDGSQPAPATEPVGLAGGPEPPAPPRSLAVATIRVLTLRLGEAVARTAAARVRDRYPQLLADAPAGLNRGGRHLLGQAAYTIALHEALTGIGVDPDKATGWVADILEATNRPAHDWLHRAALLRHRNALERLRWQSRLLCRLYYAPPAWALHEVPVPDGYGLDIHRCAIAEYYQQLGLGALCEATICVQDQRVADRYGLPAGITFTRTGTLAGGNDKCDFRYRALGAFSSSTPG